MAISWDTQISNVNVASKRADVTFTRTDDVTNDIWTKSYTQTSLDTADRIPLLDSVWAEWQKELTKRANIETFLTNLEQLANSNLDAREA